MWQYHLSNSIALVNVSYVVEMHALACVVWSFTDKVRGECMQVVHALQTYAVHEAVVEDVAWHAHHEHMFGSVGDDRRMILWDTRKPADQGMSLKPACAIHTACARHMEP